jgi:hypothetical protein
VSDKTRAQRDADEIYDGFVSVASNSWEGRQALYNKLLRLLEERDSEIAILRQQVARGDE